MKKHIFKSKSIPGLSKEYLNTLTDRHYISKQGGETTRDRGFLSKAGKAGAEANKKSGKIKDFIKAGNDKVQEMIESGEWKELAAKGGKVQGKVNADNGHMKNIAKLAQTPEVKARALATRRIGKLKKWKVFYDQLDDIHTTAQANKICIQMGKPESFGRSIMKKLGTKISFNGKTSTYKKNDNYEADYLNGLL